MEAANLSKLKEICKKIAACRRGDDWRKALHLLTTLDGHGLRQNTILLNAALNACGKCLRWDRALELLDAASARSLPRDVISYNTMVPLLPWLSALSVLLGSAGNTTCDVVTFNSLAAQMPWPEGLKTLQDVSRQLLQPDAVTYNSVISAASRWRLSQQLLVRMKDQALRSDVVSFTSCITGVDDWSSSCLWLEHFAAGQVAGNLLTFNACISAWPWRLAAMTLKDAELWRLEADVISHNAAMNGHSERWEMAMNIFQSLQHHGTRPSPISHNTLSSICDRNGIWHHMLCMLGSQPPLAAPWQLSLELLLQHREQMETRLILGSAAISAMGHCGPQGAWRRATFLMMDLRCALLRPNLIVQNSLVNVYEKSHRWQSALHVLDLPLVGALDLVTFNSSLSACEKAEQWRWALGTWTNLPMSADVVTFNAVLSACEKRQRWQRVLWILKSFPMEWTNMSCNAAIAACQKGVAWMPAVNLLGEFQHVDLQCDEVSFSSVLASLWHWQLAMHLLMQMVGSALQPGLVAYHSAVAICARAGQWRATLWLIHDAELRQTGLDTATLADALDTLSGRWDSPGICALLTRIADEGDASLVRLQRELL